MLCSVLRGLAAVLGFHVCCLVYGIPPQVIIVRLSSIWKATKTQVVIIGNQL